MVPRSEHERIRNLCVAAVGTEQNPGRINTICEDLGKREVSAWLEEHRKSEAAIQQSVRKADEFYRGKLAPFIKPDKAAPCALHPKEKCPHGVYIPEWSNRAQRASAYCGLCRESKDIPPGYDAETYRAAIKKGLAHAEYTLNRTSEGREQIEDLRQICDFEIWKATLHYGKDMDATKARKVARNVGQQFLKDFIEDTNEFLTDSAGNPILNDEGKAQGLDGAELKRKSTDKSLSKPERSEAKRRLRKFQKKRSRFEPFVADGAKTADGDLEPSTEGKRSGRESFRAAEDRAILELDLQRLRAVVETWPEPDRQMAEAILRDGEDFSIPEFVLAFGIPETTARRLQEAVLTEFKKILKINENSWRKLRAA